MISSLERVEWSRASALWIYRSEDDLKKIAAPGYFNKQSEFGMRHGDELRIVCGSPNPSTCTYAWGIFSAVPDNAKDGERDITVALLSSGKPKSVEK